MSETDNHSSLPVKPDDRTAADRWALVAEARATFGALAARQLAEKLGMVKAGNGSAKIAGEF